MNQVYINCQEVQRFLERQWQKLRGIISQDAWAEHERHPFKKEFQTSSPAARPSPIQEEEKSDDVEQVHGNPHRNTSLWTAPMRLIVEETTVTDVVVVINTICETLTDLLDAGHGYRKYYVMLLEALVKLLDILRDVERRQPDVLRHSGIFGQLKVSVSITYSLVEKVSARHKLLIFVFKFQPLACTTLDILPQKLREQVTDTKRLLKEVTKSLEVYYRAYNPGEKINGFGEGASQLVSLYGVNRLTVAANHHRDLLVTGDKITFFICDPNIKVIYTVQTWLNNPSSFFHTAKRLSASVECSSGKVYNISVPGYPNKEPDLDNRTALIISSVEHAQVRSYLPQDQPSGIRRAARKAGSLLRQSDQSSSEAADRPRQKHAGELLVHSKPKYQKYRGEIVMSNRAVKLDCIGQTHEVKRLSVEGKKHKSKVWYKCCVEVTGEVLAIYRQKRRNVSKGHRDEGVFHTLGVANNPELRDLIVCSFVAMGLNSFL